MSLLQKFVGRDQAAQVPPIDLETKKLLDELCKEHSGARYSFDPVDMSGSGKQLLALPEEARVALISYLVSCLPLLFGKTKLRNLPASQETCIEVYNQLARRLLRRKIMLSQPQLFEILEIIDKYLHTMFYVLPIAGIVSAAERVAEVEPLDQATVNVLRRIAKQTKRAGDSDLRKNGQRIRRLFTEDTVPAIEGRKEWIKNLANLCSSLPDPDKVAWDKLLSYANTASSSRPSKKWMKDAQPLIADLGETRFAELTSQCLQFVLDENATSMPLGSDNNSTTIKGLVWMASVSEDHDLLATVHDLGEYTFRKVPGHGPLSAKVGNAVIYALGAQPGIAAISRLTALKGRVKYKQAQALIEKALHSAAEARGISVDTLEELAVPALGLDDSGRIRQPMGDFTAVVEVGLGGKTTIAWEKADGKIQKSVPKAVKDDYSNELKQLRKNTKEISKTWLAQRDRVDRLMLNAHCWSVEDWQARYIEHPLMLTLARKLIWTFTVDGNKTLGCWSGGKIVDADSKPLDVPDDAEVSLWHPIGYDTDVVLDWRRFLETNEITQPFKQAHREVYIVTDAERETDLYSNRFAGHVLRQHQLAALCRERGWDYTLQGAFDSWNAPIKHFPDHGLFVEFNCEAIGDNNPVSEMGIYLFVSTDQVRFIQNGNQPMKMEIVPPLLFTEVMRDVDLFVGVCSIGNDPNWVDGGFRQGYADYWHGYAFGELSESSKIRKDVLESIVPKLKIADRLSFDGRFLVINGDLKTYRIHLGSGNIMMEPNNEYLCIVQGGALRKAQERILLPFEGDGLLSVIISKAVMLANDKKITDRTIVSQIQRGGFFTVNID